MNDDLPQETELDTAGEIMLRVMRKITHINLSAAMLLLFPILFAISPAEMVAQEFSLEESIQRGEEVYLSNCAACHRKSGKGLLGTPPLAESDYLLEDTDRAIRIIHNGMEGDILVNGKTYKNAMLPVELTDDETADVMNYILNSWGNEGGEVTPQDVQEALVPEP